MDIEYTIQIWKEDSQFVAHAMPIDLMSSGETPAAARIALNEAANLFIAVATDMGGNKFSQKLAICWLISNKI